MCSTRPLLGLLCLASSIALMAPTMQAAPPPLQSPNALAAAGPPGPAAVGSTCRRELENANRTISAWADNMETMVNESNLGPSVRKPVHAEANKILDMIEDFGERLLSQSPEQLARDLVTIRRRSNRLALDIYLNTFDMRWTQNSLQLGVLVERVQQACLDRATIQALEAPANPLNPLEELAQLINH